MDGTGWDEMRHTKLMYALCQWTMHLSLTLYPAFLPLFLPYAFVSPRGYLSVFYPSDAWYEMRCETYIHT